MQLRGGHSTEINISVITSGVSMNSQWRVVAYVRPEVEVRSHMEVRHYFTQGQTFHLWHTVAVGGNQSTVMPEVS